MVCRRVPTNHISNCQTLEATRRTTIEIAARLRLTPFHQGELDALCGVYGAINALRLAMADHAPLTKAQCKQLFAAGVEYLDRKNVLGEVAVAGMGTRRRLALARHLAKLVSTSNFQIEVERPDHSAWASIDDAFTWIDESLSEGKPVLIALMGGLNHYTVVAGSTPTRLTLFDSDGLRFIRKSSCGSDTGFHRVPFKGLLRIAVKRPG